MVNTNQTNNKANLEHGSLFGEFSRYQLIRHESHRAGIDSCWLVLDAERQDPVTGYPDVIRQAATIEEAVKVHQGVS